MTTPLPSAPKGKKKEAFFLFGELLPVRLSVPTSLRGLASFYNGGGEAEWGLAFASGKLDLSSSRSESLYLRVFEEAGGCRVR